MKYVSTRGGVPPTTFVDALLTGSPLDGGVRPGARPDD